MNALLNSESKAKFAHIPSSNSGGKQSTYREFFRAEHTAYENEKYRAKTLDPRLIEFPNWIIHVGILAEGLSVDRIDPKKGYLVGNIRQANKLTQTQNRRVTKWHTLPDGKSVTVTNLAEIFQSSPKSAVNTLRSCQ